MKNGKIGIDLKCNSIFIMKTGCVSLKEETQIGHFSEIGFLWKQSNILHQILLFSSQLLSVFFLKMSPLWPRNGFHCISYFIWWSVLPLKLSMTNSTPHSESDFRSSDPAHIKETLTCLPHPIAPVNSFLINVD